MIYLDASAAIKLVRPEPFTAYVAAAIAAEESVIVSLLAQLEVLIELKAAKMGGYFSATQWRQTEARFSLLLNQSPFELRKPSASLFSTALRQHRNSGSVHCRSLDRLHIAIMEDLGIHRLLTCDKRQSQVAEEAGFGVTLVGVPD